MHGAGGVIVVQALHASFHVSVFTIGHREGHGIDHLSIHAHPDHVLTTIHEVVHVRLGTAVAWIVASLVRVAFTTHHISEHILEHRKHG